MFLLTQTCMVIDNEKSADEGLGTISTCILQTFATLQHMLFCSWESLHAFILTCVSWAICLIYLYVAFFMINCIMIEEILQIVAFLYMFIVWKLYGSVEVIVQLSAAPWKLLYVGCLPQVFCIIFKSMTKIKGKSNAPWCKIWFCVKIISQTLCQNFTFKTFE